MSKSHFLLGATLAALSAGGVSVRAEEPTTQPAEPASQAPASHSAALDVEFLELQLMFEGAYDERRTTFETNERYRSTWRQVDRTNRLEETLGLESRGSIYGERFLLYDLSLRGGWSQEWFAETKPRRDLDADPSGSLFEYDINLTFFPQGSLSVNTYAQRLDSRVPRAFQPSLDRTRERYGVDVLLHDATLPMRWSFEHTWDELTSRTFDLEDDEQRGRDTFRYEATWQIDPHHSLRLDYEYDDRREEYSGSGTRFDTTRHYVTLNHVLRFGPKHRSRWESLLRFQEESGDLARDEFELSSRLRLQHTDWLTTNYAVQFLRDGYFDYQTETLRGEVGATLQWDEALTASFQLYGLRQQVEQGADLDEWGGLANVSFSRKNDWGRFSANASYNHADVSARDGATTGTVLAESVTLRDPLAAYLAHENVIYASVIVTDVNRSRTYLVGRDYVVLPFGRYAGIRRLQTGAIANGETVLVTYAYRVARDYDLTRDRFDFRVQQAFSWGLTPYYAGSIQDENLSHARFASLRARNANRHRVGATYRQRKWSAGIEYEFNDDSIDPYQAVHANGDVVLWQDVRNQLDGQANFSRFWFDGSNGFESRNTSLLDIGLAYRHVFARDFEANASAMYRYESDSLYGRTHGVDVNAGLDWRIGYFALRLEAEYDTLDLPGSRDSAMSVWLKLRRDIPVIAQRKR